MNWAKMLPAEMLVKGRWWEKPWCLVGGCTPVSAGCDNCWSEGMESRFEKDGATTNGAWNGKIILHESRLDKPLKIKKPTVFAIWNDLFHEDVSDEFIDRAFAVMALCPQHLFIILTKRSARMKKYTLRRYYDPDIPGPFTTDIPEPPQNVVLGVSAEKQEHKHRIDDLVGTPASGRIVSYEPALGPLNICIGDCVKEVKLSGHGRIEPEEDGKHYLPTLGGGARCTSCNWHIIDLIIMGGESGKNARPMHPAWARSTRDQCEAAGVSFFLKQNGEFREREKAEKVDGSKEWGVIDLDGNYYRETSAWNGHTGDESETSEVYVLRVGKTKAGRLLDGVLHNDLPEVG